MDKLISLNGNYIRQAEDGELIPLLQPLLADLLGKAPDEAQIQRLEILLPSLKPRAKNLLEMAENALFLFLQRPLTLDGKSAKLITLESRVMMAELLTELEALEDWSETGLKSLVRGFADSHLLKMGKVAQPLRASLTGKTISPGIFDVMISLGREESLGRLSDIAAQTP